MKLINHLSSIALIFCFVPVFYSPHDPTGFFTSSFQNIHIAPSLSKRNAKNTLFQVFSLTLTLLLGETYVGLNTLYVIHFQCVVPTQISLNKRVCIRESIHNTPHFANPRFITPARKTHQLLISPCCCCTILDLSDIVEY